MLVKMQLCWEGRINRIEDRHLPKILLYGDLSSDKCDVGGDEKKIQGFFQELHPHLQQQPLKKKQLRTDLGKKRQKGQPNHQKRGIYLQPLWPRVQKLFNIVYLN